MMNQFQQQHQGQGGKYGAHEFLETQEALQKKTAEIELYGVLIDQAQDPHLRDILLNQQRRMVMGYQQVSSFMASQGQLTGVTNAAPHTPHMSVYERTQIGLNNPQFPAPNPRATQMTDRAIATLALNLHKAGAITGMQYALECVNPQLRTLHATHANICQEMAYEIFQYMNYNGYYQVPQLANHTMSSIMEGVQPMTAGFSPLGMGR